MSGVLQSTYNSSITVQDLFRKTCFGVLLKGHTLTADMNS